MIRNKRMIKRIRIGTRNSNLALWQANFVKKRIEEHFSSVQVTLEPIKTRGDYDQVSSLTKVGGQGIFTKAIEQSLIENKIDLAVHRVPSWKEVLSLMSSSDLNSLILIKYRKVRRSRVEVFVDVPNCYL